MTKIDTLRKFFDKMDAFSAIIDEVGALPSQTLATDTRVTDLLKKMRETAVSVDILRNQLVCATCGKMHIWENEDGLTISQNRIVSCDHCDLTIHLTNDIAARGFLETHASCLEKPCPKK